MAPKFEKPDTYESVLRKYKDRLSANNATMPTLEEIQANRDSQRTGDLVGSLFKAASLVGSVGGKATENPNIDYAAAAKTSGQDLQDRIKQADLLNSQAQQDYELSRQGLGDIATQEKQARDAQAFKTNQVLQGQEIAKNKIGLQDLQADRAYNPQIANVRTQSLLMRKRQAESTGDTATVNLVNEELSNLMKQANIYAAAEQLKFSDPVRAKKLMDSLDRNYSARSAKQVEGLEPPLGKGVEKPPTDTQTLSANYANRMEEADKILTQLYKSPENTSTATSRYITQIPLYPNAFKSSNQQQEEQAKRDFLNAVLRKESGAVINESEFINGNKQYFPQPGDSPEVVAQKAKNRQESIQGLKASAGNQALSNIYKQQSPQAQVKVINGVEYVKVPGGWQKK